MGEEESFITLTLTTTDDDTSECAPTRSYTRYTTPAIVTRPCVLCGSQVSRNGCNYCNACLHYLKSPSDEVISRVVVQGVIDDDVPNIRYIYAPEIRMRGTNWRVKRVIVE